MIRITEIAPRRVLQYAESPVPTGEKVAFIDALSESGVPEIEVSAFLPDQPEQLADADEVFQRIKRKEGVSYSALVADEAGLKRAKEAGADRIAVMVTASETYNRKHFHASIDETIERLRPIVKDAGVMVRGRVGTAFWCPYDGKISPRGVVEVVNKLAALGINEVSLGDTTGRASPPQLRALLDTLPPCPLPVSMRLHDTYGMAVSNAIVAYKEFGVDMFETSAGGLSPDPHVAGAVADVATEDLVFAFEACGLKTGVSGKSIVRAARLLEPRLGRPLASRLSKVFQAQGS